MDKEVAVNRDLIRAAQEVAPILSRNASASEEACRLTDETVDALVQNGFIMMGAPSEFGGAELPWVDHLKVIEELSRADGATGWCAMAIGGHSAIFGAYLPEEGAQELFADGTPLIAGMPAPRGVAERVEGGYQFSGKFQFASGSSFANWFTAGGIVHEDGRPVLGDDGQPLAIAAVLRPDQVALEGNWDVQALEATASVDYTIAPTFVPEYMTIPMPWQRHYRGQNAVRVGIRALGPVAHSAVVLGMARRSLEEIAAIAPGRKRRDAPVPAVADQETFETELALRDAELAAVRSLYFELVAQADQAVEGNYGPIGADEAQAVIQVARYLHDVGARCATFAHEWAGTTASIRKGSVIGRNFRAIYAAGTHIVVDRYNLVQAAPSIRERLGVNAEKLAEPGQGR